MSLEDELERILEKGVEKSAEDMIKVIEKAYGEVPYIFNYMKKNPELLITKMLQNGAILRSAKSLDMRTIELISIGIAAAIRCSHCLEMHIRVASRIGINDEEIAAVLFIAGNMVNASILATATRELEDELGGCKVCSIENGACEIPEIPEEGDGKGPYGR